MSAKLFASPIFFPAGGPLAVAINWSGFNSDGTPMFVNTFDNSGLLVQTSVPLTRGSSVLSVRQASIAVLAAIASSYGSSSEAVNEAAGIGGVAVVWLDGTELGPL